MTLGGGCYCGKVRYEAAGTPMLRAQCHCRPCQYFSGGAANMFMLMPVDGFRYTKGEPRQFKCDDLERAVTREFCSDCGTQLITRCPGLTAIILKAGTLDDPTQYGVCQMAINASDRQAFNCIQEGLAIYEGLPPR
jgi:hypothetical protein